MTSISSKDLLKILEQTKVVSKTEFAKRVRISAPTLYAWIKKDKDGIAQFVTPEGISTEIFEVEPWKRFNDKNEIQREQLQNQVDDLTGEAERSAGKIAELQTEVDKLTAKNELLQQTVDMLQGQISVKDQQINALLVSLNQQIKALPEPKKGILDRWREKREAKQAAKRQ